MYTYLREILLACLEKAHERRDSARIGDQFLVGLVRRHAPQRPRRVAVDRRMVAEQRG